MTNFGDRKISKRKERRLNRLGEAFRLDQGGAEGGTNKRVDKHRQHRACDVRLHIYKPRLCPGWAGGMVVSWVIGDAIGSQYHRDCSFLYFLEWLF